MKKFWRWAVMLTLTVLIGCGEDEKPAAPAAASAQNKPTATAVKTQKPVISILLYDGSDTYISMVAAQLKQALGNDVEIEVHDAQNSWLKQTDQLDTLLKRNISAIAVNLVDIQRATELMDKIFKKNVPAVFFNREPSSQLFTTYRNICFVGTTPEDAGKMQGDILTELWKSHPEYDRNGDQKWSYIMLQGPQDNPEAVARTQFSVKQAIDNGVPLKQVMENQICMWDKNLAQQAITEVWELLESDPDNEIELIIANNDNMALGAVAALQSEGFNLEGGEPEKFIPVIGVDATLDALDAIKRGVMNATVKQDAKAMGECIAKILLNAANGKSFLEGTGYAWNDENMRDVRIPYAIINLE